MRAFGDLLDDAPAARQRSTQPAVAASDLIRQVQHALDASMDRLDVACDRFRAVGDAHELRLERLGRAVDAERGERVEQATALLTGATQLTLKLEAETARLQDADRLAAGRLRGLAERLDAALERIDRQGERLARQQEALKASETRMDELQEAQRADRARLGKQLRVLGGLLALTALLALASIVPALASQGAAYFSP